MDEILFRLSGRQFIKKLITCQDIAIAGFLYMYFFGIKLLPERDIPTEKDVALADRKPAKMIIVALVFLFIVYCMASGLLAMHLAAAVGAILVVLTGCISVEDAVKQFSVSTLFLVAGIFPLSTAMSSSGAAEYIISSLSSNLSSLPPSLCWPSPLPWLW